MILPGKASVDRPKAALVMFDWGGSRFVVLNTLNISNRTCTSLLGPTAGNLIDRLNAKSTLK